MNEDMETDTKKIQEKKKKRDMNFSPRRRENQLVFCGPLVLLITFLICGYDKKKKTGDSRMNQETKTDMKKSKKRSVT